MCLSSFDFTSNLNSENGACMCYVLGLVEESTSPPEPQRKNESPDRGKLVSRLTLPPQRRWREEALLCLLCLSPGPPVWTSLVAVRERRGLGNYLELYRQEESSFLLYLFIFSSDSFPSANEDPSWAAFLSCSQVLKQSRACRYQMLGWATGPSGPSFSAEQQ